MNKVVTIIAIVSVSFFLALDVYGADKEKPAAKDAGLTLTGQVIDKESGEVLTGVAVQIESSGEVAYSDFEGYFSFEQVSPGEHLLKASYVSYELKETLVTSKEKNGNVQVMLEMVSK